VTEWNREEEQQRFHELREWLVAGEQPETALGPNERWHVGLEQDFYGEGQAVIDTMRRDNDGLRAWVDAAEGRDEIAERAWEQVEELVWSILPVEKQALEDGRRAAWEREEEAIARAIEAYDRAWQSGELHEAQYERHLNEALDKGPEAVRAAYPEHSLTDEQIQWLYEERAYAMPRNLPSEAAWQQHVDRTEGRTSPEEELELER
jgi:hypothetical protein